MRMYRRVCAVCVMWWCVLSCALVSAQEAPEQTPQPRDVRVGFGLKYLGLADSFLSNAGQVIVPIELTGLRLEPGLSLGWRQGQDEGLLSLSGSLGVHGLAELNAWMRGYGGVFGQYTRQEFDGLGAGGVGSLSFIQVGPVVGLEARVVEGLYVGVEQQLIYNKNLDDEALGGLGGLSVSSGLNTRSVLALRWLF